MTPLSPFLLSFEIITFLLQSQLYFFALAHEKTHTTPKLCIFLLECLYSPEATNPLFRRWLSRLPGSSNVLPTFHLTESPNEVPGLQSPLHHTTASQLVLHVCAPVCTCVPCFALPSKSSPFHKEMLSARYVSVMLKALGTMKRNQAVFVV